MTRLPPGSPQRLPDSSRRRAPRAGALTPEPVLSPELHPGHAKLNPAPQIIHGGNLFSSFTSRAQPDLPPRMFSYLNRGFFELVPGYHLRMLDVWMILRDPGPFHVQTYRSNGTSASGIVTKAGQQLAFQCADPLPLQTRELEEVSNELEGLMLNCPLRDADRLSSLHFPVDTPHALQHALQQQLLEEIPRHRQCAALIDDDLPLVTASIVDGREYWLILFKLGYAVHVRLADSLEGLTRDKSHLQALGLWPVEAPPSTR